MNTKPAVVASVLAISVAAAFISTSSHAAGSAQGASPAATCASGSLSAVQRRILQKTAQSSAALRDYVYITRGIHRLDFVEAATWASQYRAQQAACTLSASAR